MKEISISIYHGQTFTNLTLAVSPIYVRVSFSAVPSLFLANQISAFSQTLNNELVTLSATIDILDIICSSLEVAGSIIALGDEDIVIDAALQWRVDGNRWTHELLFNPSKTLKTRCKLEVVVCASLGDSGHNGDVVAFRADIVCI